MRFSLLSIFLLTGYAAICSTIFVYANLWFGTVVVAATALLFSLATVGAVNHKNQFLLTFSVVGWSWLVFWLGFIAQSDVKAADWTLFRSIYSISKPIQHAAVDAGSGESKMHSFHISGMLGQHHIAPSWHNFMRFSVCISALLLGFVVGGLHDLMRNLIRRSAADGSIRELFSAAEPQPKSEERSHG
jgi:hypothetical protein